MPKKYIFVEDVFDEIAEQKYKKMKEFNHPTKLNISNDVWQLIRKSAKIPGIKQDFNGKCMDLELFIVSKPFEHLTNHIEVI